MGELLFGLREFTASRYICPVGMAGLSQTSAFMPQNINTQYISHTKHICPQLNIKITQKKKKTISRLFFLLLLAEIYFWKCVIIRLQWKLNIIGSVDYVYIQKSHILQKMKNEFQQKLKPEHRRLLLLML